MSSHDLRNDQVQAHSNMVAEHLAQMTCSASTRATECSKTLTRARRCSNTFSGYGKQAGQNITAMIAPLATAPAAASSTTAPQPLTADEIAGRKAVFQEALQQGVDSKYFDKKNPPAFTGKAEDYDKWQRDFRYYISFKSGLIHSVIDTVDVWPAGLTIQGFGEHMIEQRNIPAAYIAPALKAARELHGYIRDSLENSTVDCSAIEASGCNGLELWRVLKERYFQATAGSAINELLDILLNTNLYKDMEDFFNAFVAWELRIRRFTERFKMEFPDLLKYALCLQKAPRELITHLCSTIPHDSVFERVKSAIHDYVRHSLQAGRTNFQTSKSETDFMDVDAVNYKGKDLERRVWATADSAVSQDIGRKTAGRNRLSKDPPQLHPGPTEGVPSAESKGHFMKDCWST